MARPPIVFGSTAEFLNASPSQTAHLLLELARLQASRRRPAELLAQVARDTFVHPSFLDQRLLHQLDALALEAAEGFEALQLSPVAPLGTCSVLAPSSQDRTLTTARATEVVSDPTNMLALVCAQRLRGADKGPVRLCTVHQVLRAQPLPPHPGFSRHFRLFVLAEAGHGAPEEAFELHAVLCQLGVFQRLFEKAARTLSCEFASPKLIVKAAPRRSALRDRLMPRLAKAFPGVRLEAEPFESGYYDGLRVLFGAHTLAGEFCPLADLGLFDWVGKLLSEHRVRFVASGFGLQLLPVLFRSS